MKGQNNVFVWRFLISKKVLGFERGLPLHDGNGIRMLDELEKKRLLHSLLSGFYQFLIN
jgi:hypothetical protein